MMINLVVRNGMLNLGATAHHSPPPSAHGERAHAYAFAVSHNLAVVLVRQGRCDPAFLGDEQWLQARGVNCRARFKTKGGAAMPAQPPTETPAVAPETPTSATSAPGGGLAGIVRGALAIGRKTALMEALEAVGVDASDLSNNDKRAAALQAWLDENADQEREG